MKILHICSYYNTSSLYKYMFEAIHENCTYKQSVYVPVYKNFELVKDYGTVREKGKSEAGIDFKYDDCLKKYERFFLLKRIKKCSKRIAHDYDLSHTILHGHSLLANGGVCYELQKNFKVKYIVTIRSTDLDVLTKCSYYKPYAKKIIKSAKSIIFVSHSLKEKFLYIFPDLLAEINRISIVIPNGIPPMWLTHPQNKLISDNEKISFVYQGTFHERKELPYTIKLIEELNKRGFNCHLNLYGAGPERANIEKNINASVFKEHFFLDTWSNDFKMIQKRYIDNNFFIMLSYGETFGIAYIEALASGLPVIYRKHEGIDGFFNDYSVGIGLECKSIAEDTEKVIEAINKYNFLQSQTKKMAIQFIWRNVANTIVKQYGERNET